MSKVLKVIVTIILIVFIGSGAALIIPPFVGGLATVVVQPGVISNQSIGSWIYAKKDAAANIQTGDKLLDMDTEYVYFNEVISYESISQTAQVAGGVSTTLHVADIYNRVLVVIPFIGFLMIATQSLPGLILLGLLLGLIILLFIASAVVRRSEEDEDEEDFFGVKRDDEDDFYSSLAERKNAGESFGSARQDDKEEYVPQGDLYAGAAVASLSGTDRDEDLREPRDGIWELNKGSSEEEAPVVGKEEKPLGTGELPDVQTALEAALENQQLNRAERPKEQRPVVQTAEELPPLDIPAMPNENGEIELAIPVHSKEELLSKAYQDGLKPTVHEDEQNDVTMVDYSKCL